MKKTKPIKRMLGASFAALLLGGAVTFAFWHVQAGEIEKTATSEDLITSNKTWVNAKTEIPLTNDIHFVPQKKGTSVKIVGDGDLQIEVDDAQLLKQMADENPDFKGMKKYRLRVEADRVADYLNNERYIFPVEHGYKGLSNYRIKAGERKIKSANKLISLTKKNTNRAVETTLPVEYSDDLAKDAVDILKMNVSSGKLILDDSFSSGYKKIEARAKTFHYNFTVEKNSLLIFKSEEEVQIDEPIGIEYVMK
ncbi:hypothetical protein [Listeria kieliensis]|uniref:Uncharacterized protein n=1 Tax=Listeria kieliensis TaxID=1621700 RepID=A0A3D8TK25_9LIST|nr:hypothetical protein [Listeria kieliensis]RDW99144.1 hypothetical protein UR08_12695 [Listeria kieliensis]